MKPARILPSLLLLLLLLLLPSVKSQQAYEANAQLNCGASPNSTTVRGYACNSLPSCPSFVSFRTQPHLRSPSLLNSLLSSNLTPSSDQFPVDDLVTLPASCSCLKSLYYQHNATYRIKATGETYFTIANDTYQGLSTCQALIDQNPYDPKGLTAGDAVTVPIRCACPTPDQRAAGAKYLLTYLVTWGDDVPTVSQSFGVDNGSVLEANSLAYGDVIYPFTTLLIPLREEPRKQVQAAPPPPPAAPKAPPTPVEGGGGGGSGKKWVFVGIGIGAGFVVLCGVLGWYYFCCFRLRGRQLLGEMPVQQAKEAGVSTSDEYGALSGKASTGPFMSGEIRGFVEALLVYRFSDLEKATEFFAEDHRIRGSVYRAVINGDDAAVKRLNGDVSNEIKILKRINHSNVVRLSGFCVHEGNTYLVYEFAENGALSDWLHHGKDSVDRVLNWKQRVRVAYDVADGLNYLHNYTDPPYIHKDLKSSNILLDSEFRAKLGNFGLARAVEEEEKGLQLTRHVVGTQGYMSPEYLEHGLVTPKLDVFAFGVIILELLSGKEAIFAKDGDNKGEVLLWASIREVMKGENVRSQVIDFIDPCLGNEYPFDLAFAMAELALRCVVVEPGSRPAMAEVVTSLSAIYNSTLDWDPSDVGNMSSVVRGR